MNQSKVRHTETPYYCNDLDLDTGDLVTCAFCEWSGEVERGSDTCPNCKKEGYLMWTCEI